MNSSENDYWHFTTNFRILGYILLILALVDYVNILFPSQFTNPIWEFQTLGALVSHTPLALIGLLFVFVGGRDYRNKFEFYVVKFLSWCCLIVGILYLLFLPLGINSTWRINIGNYQKITNQSSQQISEVQKIRELLASAKTDEDVNKLFKNSKADVKPTKFKNAQEVKIQLLSQIETIEKNINNQAKAVQENTKQQLIKNSIKWNLGIIICAFAFIWLWRSTDWARLPWL